MIYFETERMVFRDWRELDTVPFRAMNKDPRVMEFFPNTLSDTQTDAFISRINDEFSTYGYGLFAVDEKDKGAFIGFIGFHWAAFQSEFTPCIEIGWRLIFKAWGKGFATEGAKACLKYGFEQLGFDKVLSFTSATNTRSQKVMKKIGMTKSAEFNHPNVCEDSPLKPHVLFKITQADWRALPENGNQ